MMSTMSQKPPCQCCSTMRDYIAQHYDPSAIIQPGDDAAEVLAALRSIDFLDGQECVLTLQNLEDYIEGLKGPSQ